MVDPTPIRPDVEVPVSGEFTGKPPPIGHGGGDGGGGNSGSFERKLAVIETQLTYLTGNVSQLAQKVENLEAAKTSVILWIVGSAVSAVIAITLAVWGIVYTMIWDTYDKLDQKLISVEERMDGATDSLSGQLLDLQRSVDRLNWEQAKDNTGQGQAGAPTNVQRQVPKP